MSSGPPAPHPNTDASALSGMARATAALSAADAATQTESDASNKSPRPPTTKNVGTDLVIAPVPALGSTQKPKMPKVDASSRNLPLFAAALCLALGIGGAIGTQIVAIEDAKVAVEETAKIEKALPWKREVAEIGARDSSKVRDELRALRAEVAALRATGEQGRQSEAQKQSGEMRSLRALLEGQKGEAASLKADVGARFDRADHDAAQRGDRLADRVDHIEKRLADPTPTASIAKTPPEPKADKPVRGIVLRDVARGVALIESKRGLMEVTVGDQVPGAGRVEAIEKRAGKWRVVTSTGVIDDIVE